MKPTRTQTTDAVATGVRRPLLPVICRWCAGARVSTLAKGPKGQRQADTCRSSSALARRRDAAPVGRSIVQCLSPYRPASSCSLQHVQLMVASSFGSWRDVEGEMDPIFIWFGVASAAGTTAISVTHDQSEFDSLGNRSPRTLSKATAHAEGAASACVLHVTGLVLRIYFMFLSIEVLHMPLPHHPERHCPRPCRFSIFFILLSIAVSGRCPDVRSVCVCGVLFAYGACVPEQKED